jgi:hypothetical protein
MLEATVPVHKWTHVTTTQARCWPGTSTSAKSSWIRQAPGAVLTPPAVVLAPLPDAKCSLRRGRRGSIIAMRCHCC